MTESNTTVDINVATQPKPMPVLRKEVVATKTWGELVVRQLKASEASVLWSHAARFDDAGKPLPKYAQADHSAEAVAYRESLSRDYTLFIGRLMALAVIAKDGAAMYTADQWDVWQQTTDEPTPHGAADCLDLADRALVMNGYEPLRKPKAAEEEGAEAAVEASTAKND